MKEQKSKCPHCGKDYTSFSNRNPFIALIDAIFNPVPVENLGYTIHCDRCGITDEGHKGCLKWDTKNLQIPERMREGDFGQYSLCPECYKVAVAEIYGQSDLRIGKLAFEKGYKEGKEDGYNDGYKEGYKK